MHKQLPTTPAEFFKRLSDRGCERPAAIYSYCELMDIDPQHYDIYAMHGTEIDDNERAELIRVFGSVEAIPAILLTDEWDT